MSLGDSEVVERFLKSRYELLALSSLAVAASIAAGLIFFGPILEAHLGGTQVSMFVLKTAAVANVCIVVFMANALFLIFMNRIHLLVPIAAMGLCLLAVFGVFLAHFGFQYISVAYLLAAIATMVISSAEVYQCLKRPGGLFFSRYI